MQVDQKIREVSMQWFMDTVLKDVEDLIAVKPQLTPEMMAVRVVYVRLYPCSIRGEARTNCFTLHVHLVAWLAIYPLSVSPVPNNTVQGLEEARAGMGAEDPESKDEL
jgi:hypothetical protein